MNDTSKSADPTHPDQTSTKTARAPRTRDEALADVEGTVLDVVSDRLGVARDELHRETRFIEIGDSLDAVEIVMELEDTYGLRIPDEDSEKLKSIGQVIDYVKDKARAVSNDETRQA
jgi:acyl carrier protein